MSKFENNELIVLKRDFNDTNYKRIFRVLKAEDNQLTIAKEVEIDAKTNEKVTVDNKAPIGTFDDYLFEKYL